MRIGERRDASSLAFVIAGIAHNAEKRDERDVWLGAIFGAFAGLESRRVKEAVLGPIGGARRHYLLGPSEPFEGGRGFVAGVVGSRIGKGGV
jgi:hypothetical protein